MAQHPLLFPGLHTNPTGPVSGTAATPTESPAAGTTGPTPPAGNVNESNPFSGLGINPDVLNQFMSTMVSCLDEDL